MEAYERNGFTDWTWALLVSSWLAADTAGAMVTAGAWGRTGPAPGEYRRAANVPGRRRTDALRYELREPAVRQGQ
jgi:hypothetical protein